MDFEQRIGGTAYIQGEPLNSGTQYMVPSATIQWLDVALAGRAKRLSEVLRARLRTARKLGIKAIGRAGGRRGHGLHQHDGGAQPCAARGTP